MTLAALVASLAALAPSVGAAQPHEGAYASVGYANVDLSRGQFDAGQARVGYRFHRFGGVEGEFALGLGEEDLASIGGTFEIKLKRAYAVYAVGFVPLSPKTDILARIGYGETRVSIDVGSSSFARTADSINFGAGVQHHFDGRNGVRFDYTRYQSQDSSSDDADVWSIAFSRRF